jgi:molybdopterin converting factor small subunit
MSRWTLSFAAELTERLRNISYKLLFNKHLPVSETVSVMYVATLDILTEKGGFDPRAARAIGEAIDLEIARSRDVSATRKDLNECRHALSDEIGAPGVETERSISTLRAELGAVRAELKQDISSLRAELKQDIRSLRAEVKQDIRSLRTELKGDVNELRVCRP